MKEKEIDDDDDDDTDGSPPFKSSKSIFSKFCRFYSCDIPLSIGSRIKVSKLLSIFYKNIGRMHTANRRLCYQGECRESNQGSGQCSIINEDLEGAQDRRQEKEDICKALK